MILQEILTQPLSSKLYSHAETNTRDTNDIGTSRGSVFSFYYISRIIFYVPLYYQLCFCFLFLYWIGRSVYLHKVNSIFSIKLKFMKKKNKLFQIGEASGIRSIRDSSAHLTTNNTSNLEHVLLMIENYTRRINNLRKK